MRSMISRKRQGRESYDRVRQALSDFEITRVYEDLNIAQLPSQLPDVNQVECLVNKRNFKQS